MYNKMVLGFRNVCEYVGIRYNLEDLNSELKQAQKRNDPKLIMKYIQHIDSFWEDKKITAIQILKDALWMEIQPNIYTFTPLFAALTCDDLLTVLKKLGNSSIITFIFKRHPNQLVSHYSIGSSLKFLSSHYSDSFALFVFDRFIRMNRWLRGTQFLEYLNIVSIDIAVMVLDKNDISALISLDSLMTIFHKMIQCIKVTHENNIHSNLTVYGYIRHIEQKCVHKVIPLEIYSLCSKYLNYESTFMCICTNVVQKKVRSLTIKEIYFMFDRKLVLSADIKYIIMELKKRENKFILDIKSTTRLVETKKYTCDKKMYVPDRIWLDKSDEAYIKTLKSHIGSIKNAHCELSSGVDRLISLHAHLKLLQNVLYEIETWMNMHEQQQEIEKYQRRITQLQQLLS